VGAPEILLTDTGPLVSLIDPSDPAHEACTRHVTGDRGPIVTTWPCVTEAMFVLRRDTGWPGQAALWGLVRGDGVIVMDLDVQITSRCHELMKKYVDVPMALAEATLVALAERLHQRTVFTLDSAFSIYRLNNRQSIDVVP
jgi:predicted nucleic acid-binding protein